ncbi:MAG: hypothetical protein DI533_14795 [Cereibacter sphaeroides]|uniref:Uncharacterized protein n=1 Tax=Cereibacter sphaeroides TaxID=1063 RepID=A0A2W5TM82_CERSP|nr:MAG: hypothetical protein DI533_14795 [Cereibacter sphaeroides]
MRSSIFAVGLLVFALSTPAFADHAHRVDNRKCQQMGFRQGTRDFSNCLLQLETNRANQQAAQARAQGQRDAASIQARAAKDAADQDAWDARTGQGKYANRSQQGSFIPQQVVQEGSTQPPPKFDRNGNPNYDEDGNYIGGNGLGTLVDSPDNQPQPADPAQDVADMIQQDSDNIENSICAEADPNAGCN